MAAKLARLTHKNSDTTASRDRELYHLPFSLQAAGPENFGYTLIQFIYYDQFHTTTPTTTAAAAAAAVAIPAMKLGQ
jgi:hypothetical protein